MEQPGLELWYPMRCWRCRQCLTCCTTALVPMSPLFMLVNFLCFLSQSYLTITYGLPPHQVASELLDLQTHLPKMFAVMFKRKDRIWLSWYLLRRYLLKRQCLGYISHREVPNFISEFTMSKRNSTITQ